MLIVGFFVLMLVIIIRIVIWIGLWLFVLVIFEGLRYLDLPIDLIVYLYIVSIQIYMVILMKN